MVCEPCFAEDLQVQATQFCKTCDDPEPLCETCAKHHLRQKISRNHELCGNIREFRFKETQDWYLILLLIQFIFSQLIV